MKHIIEVKVRITEEDYEVLLHEAAKDDIPKAVLMRKLFKDGLRTRLKERKVLASFEEKGRAA